MERSSGPLTEMKLDWTWLGLGLGLGLGSGLGRDKVGLDLVGDGLRHEGLAA